jgi:hypothetical protein
MRQDRTEWAISRLRTMPEHIFYRSIILLSMGHRQVSSTTRMLLKEHDRGALQSVTFHTLRTYLTPVHGLLRRGLKFASDLAATPAIYQEAQKWLAKQKPTDSAA